MKMNTISTHHATILYWQALLEKCSYSEFIWSVLSRIRTEYRDIDVRQRHAEYLSIFTANVRKYGREILWTSTLFTQTKAQKNGILSRWRYFLLTNYFDCRAFKHFRKFLNYDCFHVFFIKNDCCERTESLIECVTMRYADLITVARFPTKIEIKENTKSTMHDVHMAKER